MTILSISNLYQSFASKNGLLPLRTDTASVLNGISFTVASGEIVGIVGESGSGKSTLAKVILRLLQPTQGGVQYQNKDIFSLPKKEYYHQVQMIFQDPFSSLNPKMRIRDQLRERILLYHPADEVEERIKEALEEVGLPLTAQSHFAHEFSGGQRQRIAIARALITSPQLLIADEPVSALDVSVQAQVLNLLKELQQKKKVTLLFISHDLEVVEALCDRVIVMYLGRIMEMLPAKNLSDTAQHPYSQALLASIPHIEKRKAGLQLIEGELPSPFHLPQGCAFASRCPHRTKECTIEQPQLSAINQEHQVACYHRM